MIFSLFLSHDDWRKNDRGGEVNRRLIGSMDYLDMFEGEEGCTAMAETRLYSRAGTSNFSASH